MGSAGELLHVEPLELQFPFELKKQISCSVHLRNKTDDFVAFKVKTTSPKKYCVRPNVGIVPPRSACDVTITMQAQKEMPPELQCRDKFLVQSVATSSTIDVKQITQEMFSNESGNKVDEVKLRVVYVPPPRPSSPVAEEYEESGSPGAFVSDSGTVDGAEYSTAMALISKLTKEKTSAIDDSNTLRKEMELLHKELANRKGGFSIIFVVVVALLGFLLGYLLRT